MEWDNEILLWSLRERIYRAQAGVFCKLGGNTERNQLLCFSVLGQLQQQLVSCVILFQRGLPTPRSPRPQPPTWLTLQQCIEGTWGRQVGGYGDIILAGCLYPDMHWAVCITSETAHLASREGHIGQAPKAVVPEIQGVALSNRNIIVPLLELGKFYLMPWFCMFCFSFWSDTFPRLPHLLGHHSTRWYPTVGKQLTSLNLPFLIPQSGDDNPCPVTHHPGFLWARCGGALSLCHPWRVRWWCPYETQSLRAGWLPEASSHWLNHRPHPPPRPQEL